MKQKKYTLLLICISILLSVPVLASVKLPALFSDGMVLQQQKNAAFWGWANPGERITIQPGWNQKPVSAVTPKNGIWRISIPTPSYGGPYKIKISGDNAITLKDVFIGEVWLCSGQSNMGFTVKGAENAQAEIASADFPEIRYFSVKRQYGPEAFEDSPGAVWQKASPSKVAGFSAVAYFFARKIYLETGMPIGIIFNAWGGTPAEAWTPVDTLTGDTILTRYLQRWAEIEKQVGPDSAKYNEKLDMWIKKHESVQGKQLQKPTIPQSLYYFNRPWRAPGVLYHGMICPVAPYTIKGVLWYQGESNVSYADEYYHLFTALIRSWRAKWKQEIPFYFVQIAPYGYKDLEAAARLREAQHRVAKTIPETEMVATADIGNMKNIHPKFKKEVGNRLARIALAKNYGKTDLVYKGPEIKKMTAHDGVVHLEFNQPLVWPRDPHPTGFEIGYKEPGADSLVFVKARTRLVNNIVLVWSEKTTNPLIVRYAWKLAADGNLSNDSGIPAYPFRVFIKPQ